MPKVGVEPIRRDQIRRAAVKLIADRGFDRTTLREVAQAVQVSTGMINHYYANKTALLVDALVSASEWFQETTRRAIADAEPGHDRLRVLVRVGVFNDSPEAIAGQKIWAWALAESIKSEELMGLIQERRRLFQEIIAGVLRQFDTATSMSDEDVRELAAEYDSYFNGLSIHLATGAKNLDVESVASSMLAVITARLRGGAVPR